jgi:alkyldihydroxyacetonephosphate synthase
MCTCTKANDMMDVMTEGILGIVTEVVLRLRPRSEVTRYGSMIFPNFESGVACMHDVAMQR